MWNLVHGYPTGTSGTVTEDTTESSPPTSGAVRVRQPSSSPSDQERASLLSDDSSPPNTYSYYFQNINYAIQNNQPDASERTWKERIAAGFKNIWRQYTCAISMGFAVICLIIIVTCAHAIENALAKDP